MTMGNGLTQLELDKALIQASVEGDISDVKYWIGQGAKLHYESGHILSCAIRGGHLSLVKYLVTQGINIDGSDGQPMCWAIMGDHLEIVRCLHQAGADLRGKGEVWPSPLKSC